MNRNPSPADVREAHDLITAGERAANRIREAGREWPDHAEALALWLSRGTYPGAAMAALIDGDAWRLLQVGEDDTWQQAPRIMRALYDQALWHVARAGSGRPCEDWSDALQDARETLKAAAAGIEWPRP